MTNLEWTTDAPTQPGVYMISARINNPEWRGTSHEWEYVCVRNLILTPKGIATMSGSPLPQSDKYETIYWLGPLPERPVGDA